MSLKVRKKKNSSGSTSIHIVDRTNRGYKVVESLGSSKNKDEIESLYNKALERIDELENNLLHISKNNSKKEQLLDILSHVTTDIESCIFEHTKKVMNNEIVLTFYDVTTLYFENDRNRKEYHLVVG